MFEAFYGFTTTPFTRTVAACDLFPSGQYQELLARLRYLVRNRGFGLVTGEVGSGKTTAIRALAAGLDLARHQLVYVSQSALTPRHLYRTLGRQLGLEPAYHAADARRQLTEALWQAYSKKDKLPVVVIDEGHLLSGELLEEIRFLTNFELDSASPMALCLVGQGELRQRLRLQTFQAIAQRVTLRYHLQGLPDQETRAYVQHHLKVAGADRPLFSDEAVRLVHQFSKGLPRRINNLCLAALLAGFAAQKPIIDEATVKQALAEVEGETVP